MPGKLAWFPWHGHQLISCAQVLLRVLSGVLYVFRSVDVKSRSDMLLDDYLHYLPDDHWIDASLH